MNIIWDTGSPEWCFCGFTQSLQTNYRVVSQVMAASFQILFTSSVVLSFVTLESVQPWHVPLKLWCPPTRPHGVTTCRTRICSYVFSFRMYTFLILNILYRELNINRRTWSKITEVCAWARTICVWSSRMQLSYLWWDHVAVPSTSTAFWWDSI